MHNWSEILALDFGEMLVRYFINVPSLIAIFMFKKKLWNAVVEDIDFYKIVAMKMQ